MNLLTVSAAGLMIFAAYLIIVMYLLRMLVARFPNSKPAQGIAAIIL